MTHVPELRQCDQAMISYKKLLPISQSTSPFPHLPGKVPGVGERRWRVQGLRIQRRNPSLYMYKLYINNSVMIPNENNNARCSGWFTKLAGGFDSKKQANNDTDDHERNVSDHGCQVEPQRVLSILSCFLIVSSAVCFSCLCVYVLCKA